TGSSRAVRTGPEPPGLRASNRKVSQPLAVHAHFEPMRLGQAANVSLVGAVEIDLEHILAVHGEVMVDGDTAARSEGQVLASAIVLPEVLADGVLLGAWREARIAHGKSTDLDGRRQIPLEEQRR